MEYIHIRSLERYHPGYKDRSLKWAKIYFGMVQGDPDCELIDNEIDWGRLIKIIILELQARKPLPNIEAYWVKKGFNVRKRPMSLTLKMLHNFIVVVTQDEKVCSLDKDKEEDKEEDVVTQKTCNKHLTTEDFIKSLKNNLAYKGIDINKELGKMDAWLSTRPGRQKTQRFIVNWLNKTDKPMPVNENPGKERTPGPRGLPESVKDILTQCKK